MNSAIATPPNGAWTCASRIARRSRTSIPACRRFARAAARKSAGLKAMIRREKLNGVIVGIRRDEQSTRAKERVFSRAPTRAIGTSPIQPAEFWDHYKARVADDEHVRVHPLLGWTELDIWRYTKAEGIPVVPAYLAEDGCAIARWASRTSPSRWPAWRLRSTRSSRNWKCTKVPERAGRTMDHEAEDSFERLRNNGYM
jgi:sulfate adenylyltransferase subunit 2